MPEKETLETTHACSVLRLYYFKTVCCLVRHFSVWQERGETACPTLVDKLTETDVG